MEDHLNRTEDQKVKNRSYRGSINTLRNVYEKLVMLRSVLWLLLPAHYFDVFTPSWGKQQQVPVDNIFTET